MTQPLQPSLNFSAAFRRNRNLIFALAALIVQPVIFFWTVLINPRNHIPFDIQEFHFPLIAYIARCAREGTAPFWDPFPYCGVPIHADSQAQLFYPLNWIAILLGNISHGRYLYYWVEWLIPLHMMIAGLLTFALLRHLRLRTPAAFLGASMYQLGGFFASQAEHLGAICAAAWLPLLLLAAFKLKRGPNRLWIGILALAAALAILAGFAPGTLVVLGALGLVMAGLWIAREASWKLAPAVACALVLAVAITAVQVIPTYQLAKLSIASLRSDWHVTGGGLPLQSLASFVLPNYHHILVRTTRTTLTPLDPNYRLRNINFTFLYIYCGLAAVALIAVAPFFRKARLARMFFVLTILSAVWMLGDKTPIYAFLYQHLPRDLRGALYAECALMAFGMFAGITAAISLDRLFLKRSAMVLWIVALATSADLIYAGSCRTMNTMPGSYRGQTSEYWIGGAPGALERMQAAVNTATPPVRIDYMDERLAVGLLGPDMVKLPTANGDNPFLLKRVLYLRRLFCGGHYWERNLAVNRPGSPMLDMLNIGVISSVSPLSEEQVRQAGLESIKVIHGLNFYRNPKALPRFFLAPRLYISSGLQQTLRRLADPAFRPAEEAVVETPGLRGFNGPLASGSVRVNEYAANHIELTVNADGKAFLASSEPLYPGWTAQVNGKPAEFLMTNGAFRGLFLGSGESRIVMDYRPVGFTALAILSSLSFLLVMGVIIYELRSSRKHLGRIGALVKESIAGVRPVIGRFRAVAVSRTARALFGLLAATASVYWKILFDASVFASDGGGRRQPGLFMASVHRDERAAW